MAKYFFTNRAIEDLSEIWNYTFEVWSEAQADRYYNSLLEYCQDLADNPALGRRYNQIDPNLLGYNTSHQVIFYSIISNKEIEILRILHNRMDLRRKILE